MIYILFFYTISYKLLGDFMIKKYLISYGYTFATIFVGTFILTILNYFNIVTTNFTNITKLIILIFSIFIGSFILGKKSLKKGYIEGIKYSIVFIVLLVIINLLFVKEFNVKSIIYFLIIIISSTFGSMLGINKKRN